MDYRKRLLFGPLSAVVFVVGTTLVALFLPGYSHVRQAVSDIGAQGTPTRLAFAGVIYALALCLLGFAYGLRDFARTFRLPALPAYLTLFVVASQIGIATFAAPHRLPEAFGLVSLVGYQAPGTLAVGWRHIPALKPVVFVSWLVFAALWIVTAVILLPDFSPLAHALEPVAGLVQRLLFVAWFGWCAWIGVSLSRLNMPVL